MKKTFDAVEFQRKRRAELSRKFEKMTPKEIMEYLKRHSIPSRKIEKGARHSA